MVKYSEAALDATFGALADPTRRAILARLAQGETSVMELASRFDISLPGVTKHLRVLEEARLLASNKQGRVRRCRLEPRRLRDAAEWILFYQRFWEDQLDALEDYLAETADEEEPWQQKHPQRKPESDSKERSRRRRSGSSTRGRTPRK
jgi:DNA-binding transcriptional ArsR family regulator